ncbi:MAG: site-specific DNA-methyltransferase, partial [Gemmataceae bacterium]|nr:site-specific DNA-methyltransferase [Gemmataceae bacterium]
MKQQALFDPGEGDEADPRSRRSGSFVDNLQLPVHRWFRYSAGFSAEWVGQLIREVAAGRPIRVFDPFVGSGTVVLEAERAGAEGIGVEAHPFVARVARAKLSWRADWKALRQHARRLVQSAQQQGGTTEGYAPLIRQCFPPAALELLDALKRAWQQLADRSPASELCWLALVSILRAVSPVGTAQWQYILPKKAKAKVLEPIEAFQTRVRLFAGDMAAWQEKSAGPPGKVYCEDARQCPSVPAGWADLVVTSPPYANNYDYADATRLEMTFLGEISGWGDLQSAVREHLIRSCTQHVAPYASRTAEVLAVPELQPLAGELPAVCAQLEAERDKHGGKKPYHAMIAHYFLDLALVWQALRRVTRAGGKVCFVIGDSAPYGVHVPVDRWLGELALAAGFKAYRFEKLRDRNVKWKNRKHRV